MFSPSAYIVSKINNTASAAPSPMPSPNGGNGGTTPTPSPSFIPPPVTYVYTAQLDNDTTFEQAYTFHPYPIETTFANLTFGISASSLKWSVNLTTSGDCAFTRHILFPSPSASVSAQLDDDDDDPSDPTPDDGDPNEVPLTMRFRLSGFLLSGSAFNTSHGSILIRPNTPRANMTTYYLPLISQSATSTVAAEVQVFDVALLDGMLRKIQHSVILVSSNSSTTDSSNGPAAEYVLELSFPSFNCSLYYDPSLGLGVLVGSDPSSPRGDDISATTGVIIALAIVLPLAAVIVLSITIVGGIVLWHRTRVRNRRILPSSTSQVNFDDDL